MTKISLNFIRLFIVRISIKLQYILQTHVICLHNIYITFTILAQQMHVRMAHFLNFISLFYFFYFFLIIRLLILPLVFFSREDLSRVNHQSKTILSYIIFFSKVKLASFYVKLLIKLLIKLSNNFKVANLHDNNVQ